MKKVAVLIPCYNEAQTIEKVVREFRRALPEADVYVFDNNSTDGTDAIAQKAGAIVRYEHRQGKGNVIRTMFRTVRADCYLMVDGDDTYPAECARRLCDEVLLNGADMVIGDRLSGAYFTENKRMFHNGGNAVVRKIINWFFQGGIPDAMTGYRAFSELFVKSFPILSKGFEIETEMSIFALEKNFYIKSVPVAYRDRPAGSVSKLSTFSDGAKVLFTIFKLYKNDRPLPFFAAIGTLFLLLGACLFVPIFSDFLRTGLVPRFPTLIVSCLSVLFAMLCYMCGLILDTASKNAKDDFEHKLNVMQMLIDEAAERRGDSAREDSGQCPPADVGP